MTSRDSTFDPRDSADRMTSAVSHTHTHMRCVKSVIVLAGDPEELYIRCSFSLSVTIRSSAVVSLKETVHQYSGHTLQ